MFRISVQVPYDPYRLHSLLPILERDETPSHRDGTSIRMIELLHLGKSINVVTRLRLFRERRVQDTNRVEWVSLSSQSHMVSSDRWETPAKTNFSFNSLLVSTSIYCFQERINWKCLCTGHIHRTVHGYRHWKPTIVSIHKVARVQLHVFIFLSQDHFCNKMSNAEKN